MSQAPGLRVLVVEDDADDFFLFSVTLQKIDGARFEIVRESTYEAGLAAILGGGFDIHFLDYRLGARDGIELLQEARRRGAVGAFIMLTGAADRSTDLAAMHAGAADYLVKDRLAPEALDRAIRYAVERERTAAELRRARDELELRVAERTRELNATVTELRQANLVKDEFLASLSHELRTPLNSIVGYMDLVLQGAYESEAELRSWLETVERNARAQSRLIEDLLDVSRVVNGKLTLAPAALDLGRLVADVAATMRVQAERRKLELVVDAAAEAFWLVGDRGRLEQVVTNLVANAVKFTPAGGRIEVDLERTPTGSLRLVVRDNGQGISPQFLPHVFDRFRQEDGRITRRQAGLGLGLALVRALVDAHGGTVAAHSDGPGRGAAFVVELPAITTVGGAESVAVELPAASQIRLSADILTGIRVLVIDDSDDVRRFTRTVLSRCGASVREADCAPAGRDALAEGPVDVILCDIGMPGESGYDFIRSLRSGEHGQGEAIPAAAMTAYARAEEQERAIAAGYEMHLSKPVTARELVEAVAALAIRAAVPTTPAEPESSRCP